LSQGCVSRYAVKKNLYISVKQLNNFRNAIPFRSPADAFLSDAAVRYFNDPNDGNLDIVGALLSREGQRIGYKAALIVQAANAVLDEEVLYITKTIEGRGGSVQCRQGCTACCEQAILCDPFEAALIGIYLMSNSECREYFNESYQRWDEKTKNIRSDFLAWAEKYYINGIDTGSHQAFDYYTPCPFLCDDLCKVYQVRPYVCRGYIALSESCKSPENPDARAGMNGIDSGSYTKHKNARTAMSRLLCRKSEIDQIQIYGKHMPDLVHDFLISHAHESIEKV
jgi:Fe-S-cluster containining protein